MLFSSISLSSLLGYRVSYDHDKNVRSIQSNEMIKIQEIIIFPSVTQKNVDTELRKCEIMAWHDIGERNKTDAIWTQRMYRE